MVSSHKLSCNIMLLNYLIPQLYNSSHYLSCFNPFAPGDFGEKRVLKLVEWFSDHCRAIKELKLTTNRLAGRTLGGLLIQMQNISLRSSGMRRKQNFSSLLFSLFLPHFFFSCWAFSRLRFGGKSF